jgi:ribosomal protein L15
VAFEVSGASEKAIKLIEKAGSKITIIGSAEK